MKQPLPIFSGDLYSRAAIANPYPEYEKIRRLGPIVSMPKRKMLVVGRYDDVKVALRDDKSLISGKGVAANRFINGRSDPMVLISDGETHLKRRHVLIKPIMPGPLKERREKFADEVDAQIRSLLSVGTFDGVTELASYLPLSIVAQLVGLNEFGRQRMLGWAAAVFNFLGVANYRSIAGLPQILQVTRYVKQMSRDKLVPGGWADRLFDAADEGVISLEEAKAMVLDYVAPALDTTILASGEMLYRLAADQTILEEIRNDPGLIPGVVNESVRLASPLRGFTRFAETATSIGGQEIPAGNRVLILFASANSDETHYQRPREFDLRRNPRDHVGWGHGQHSCAGMHLARMEMEVLLEALARNVKTIEIEKPKLIVHNVLQGFAAMPMRLQSL